MNRQEAFDKALIGIWKQGGFSFDKHSCVYRNPNGRKCAVGHLISDKEYTINMDVGNKDVYGLEAHNLLPKKLKSLMKDKFLLELQRAHDEPNFDSNFMSNFLIRMLELGKHFNLDVSKVKRRIRMLKDKEK